MISERFKNNEFIFKLITEQDEQNKLLGDINNFVPSFLLQLWNNPKSIATILLKSEKNDIKKYLANFVTHNLYYNISSLNHKDEQLIYIIAILLKEEINSLKSIDNFFFSDNRSGIILEELNKKKEMKLFFKTVVLEIIKKMENDYANSDIIFNPSKIKVKLQELNNNENEQNLKDNNDNNKNNEDDKNKNYNSVFLDIIPSELEKELLKYNDNKDMKDFIGKIINDCTLNPDKYINESLFNNITKEDPNNLIRSLNYYKSSFKQAVDIIDMLFDNLLNKSDSLPYIIKSICKIISILIEKKFPNAIKVEKNKLLVNFFFHTLFFPVLINPSLNFLINEVVISDSTINKLQTIMSILNSMTIGELFEKNNYTPFNWYIIEKMPILMKFLDNICQIKLSPFIEKLINDELPESYEYDYFTENPEEDILYRNIRYTFDQLYSLISNAVKLKEEIAIDKRLLSKFEYHNKKLERLKKTINIETPKNNNDNNSTTNKKEIKCFLLTDSINNEKLDKILNIKKYDKKFFTLNEIKIIETKEQKIQNDIIKIKNFFYALLYNYPTLLKNNYKEEKLTNIINILKELKNSIYINSLIYMDNNSIPINWYIDSLIQYLSKLPENLIKDDYKQLLDEIEKDIINSIKELNFEKLCIFIEYFKNIQKEKLYYKNIFNIMTDIDLNKNIQNIAKNERIYVSTKPDDKNYNEFFKKLKKDNKKFFKTLFEKNKKHIMGKIYSNTINKFIYNIPNISKFVLFKDIDIFKFIEDLKIPEIIDNYMLLIKNTLKEDNNFNFDEKRLETIINKIYDYIMEKLYFKLFPKEPDNLDMHIFQNCYKHTWIELQHLINKKKNYIFDNYLPDTIESFQHFIMEKSPRQKLLCVQQIFNCIYNLGKFNGDNVDGADDEMPLLSYAFIKSKPERIYSNCKYTEIFLGKKKTEKEGNQLTKILGICEQMKGLSYENLFNIDESDYIKYCELALKS